VDAFVVASVGREITEIGSEENKSNDHREEEEEEEEEMIMMMKEEITIVVSESRFAFLNRFWLSVYFFLQVVYNRSNCRLDRLPNEPLSSLIPFFIE